jgi:Cell wall-active antibiotics response 4TMS YvqF
MMRPLIRLLGLAFLAGLIIPPIAALVTKYRLGDQGRGTFLPEANDLDTALIFDGGEYTSTAPSFTGGELLTWYGGGRLDLRGATLAADGADLRIRAIFGGVQIIVPSTWRIESESTSIFGGVADQTDAPEDPAAPVLRVTTMAVFGGVAISNEAGESMFDGDLGEIVRSATDAAREAVDEATADAKTATSDVMEAATADQAS